MALLELNGAPINLLMNPPEVSGDVQATSPTYFEVVNGPQTIEIGGFGFIFDPVSGDPIAGTVTGIDWLPSPSTPFDFTLTGISWQLDGPQGGVGDDGTTVDGMFLMGSLAEWATWLSGDDVELGSDFGDVLAGFQGNDTLWGNGGDDQLEGWSGNDEIHGGDGNDNLLGGAGDDTLDGGNDFDWANYWNAPGAVTVNLASGTATGAAGNDVLIGIENVGGSNFDDILVGDAFFNQFTGGLGNDFINGGDGQDWANYWDATSGVIVDLNAGRAFGGAGNDTLIGIENVGGSSHNDTIFGSMAATAPGTPGGNLRGELGDDSIVGGASNEFISGGAGNDFIEGGLGIDTADYQYTAATGGVNVNLATGVVTGAEGNDTLSGIENVTGTNFDDTIVGNAANNFLQGFAGNDVLQGGAGSDFLVGGTGSDTIDGGVVLDRVNYSDANTASWEEDNSGVTIDLSGITGDGSTGSGTATSFFGTDVLTNVNFIRGGSGNDSITGSSALIFEQFEGGLGNDTIDGGAITDTTGLNNNRVNYLPSWGPVAVDFLAGTAQDGMGGTDTLININQVRASNFNDTLLGSNRTDVRESFEGRAGNDSIDGRGGLDIVRYDNAGGGVQVNLATGLATGADGADTLVGIEQVRGSNFNDLITGDDGNNLLEGMSGNDNLIGGAGDDTLLGGAGSDALIGGAGNDVLDGGAILDRINYSDLNTANYASDTVGVTVNLSGITGDGNSGSGVASGTDIGNDQLKSINRVFTGSGNDSILGSSAAVFEIFDGGAGNDTIDGGAMLDSLQIGSNRVVYSSMSGGVSVTLGTGGNGTATGTATGNDVLRNIHAVYGTTGDDTIIGSDDNTYSESFAGQRGNDFIDGRGGIDILRADASNGNLNVNLATGRMTSSDTLEGVDTLVGIEGVYGGNGNDVLTGGNTASGATFTDGKLEIFRGGGGNDTINGGVGMDRADYSSSTTGVHVDLGAGRAFNDGVFTSPSPSIPGVQGQDTLIGIEAIRGSEFDDTLVGTDRGPGTDGYFEFFEGRGGNDLIDGKGGIDRVDYNFATGGINVNLADGRAWQDGYGGTDTLVGIENVRGSNWNDTIRGDAGNNVLEGGAGQDVLQGGAGNDTIDGGVVTDKVNYTDGNFLSYSQDTLGVNINLSGITGDGSQGSGTATARSTLAGNSGTDVLRNVNFIVGGQGSDSITGSSASIFEMFEGGLGNDTIDGGAVTDSSNANRVTYASGNSQSVIVDLAAGTATGAGIGTDKLVNINQVRGSNSSDTISGSDRADFPESFEGRGGNDLIDGRGGIDIIRYDLEGLSSGVNVNLGTGIAAAVNGTDTLAGIEQVYATSHADVLTGGGTSHDYSNNSVFELFRGLGGNDTIDGGDGFDRVDYATSGGGVNVDLAAGTAQDGFGGTDTLSNIEGVIGSNNNDTMYGTDRDTYDEDGYVETFQGNRGSDFIDGRGGADVVIYAGSTAGVNVNLATGTANDGMGGNDTLVGIEAVVGSEFNDVLTGNDANNRLDGRKGADTMVGGAGDDRYIVDSLADVVTELADGGADTVDLNLTAAGTYTMTANVENVTVSASSPDSTLAIHVVGNASDNLIIGNAGNNSLSGGAGNDTLDGGLGSDTLAGGAGDDLYRINVATDVVSETIVGAAGGWDVVEIGYNPGTYTLGANIEEAALMVGGASNLVGNALDNWLDGNDAANVLSGGLGNDTLVGNGGNDTFDGGAGDDVAWIEGNFDDFTVTRPDAATTVLTSGSNIIKLIGVETIRFLDGVKTIQEVQAGWASPFADALEGGDGDDSIDGFAGNDTLAGLGGNDTLNGGSGADSLIGGQGDDTFIVDDLGDKLVELADEGIDEAKVGLTLAGTYVLADNVENATITTALLGVNVTGNALDNVLVGGAGANVLTGAAGNDTLDGGLGNDTLAGGLGDDVYVVNVATDVVSEALNQGQDEVQVNFTAAGTYTMALNVENATVTTASSAIAVNVTGNASNNDIAGHAGNNVLSGGLGDDILRGNGGSDTFDGGAGNDVAWIDGNFADFTVTRPDALTTILTAGSTVITLRGVEAIRFLDGEKTLEEVQAGWPTPFNDLLEGDDGDNTIDGLAGNDTLSGAGGNDSLVGGLGDDQLDGSTGDDTMVGGAGNDTYIVDAAGDVVTEAALGGTDTIRTTLDTYTIATLANVENLAYDGSGNFTGTGNAAANVINGGAGNDRLDGGVGNDTLAGGLGDDTYVINVATDVITEAASAGDDTVEVAYTVAGTYALGANIENATVTGSVATNLTGNLLDNRLEGNAANNLISGGAGADMMIVTAGSDTLDGGADSDTVIFSGNRADWSAVSRLNATDLQVRNGDSIVTMRNVETFVFDDVTMDLAEFLENSLSAFNDSWTGTDGDDESGDALAGNDTLNGGLGNDTLNGGLGADSMVGGQGNDTFIVDNLGDKLVELADEGIDEAKVGLTVAGTYVLADNVENATITTALLGVNVTGNALDNVLVGGAGANILTGAAGNDTLDGGLGSDTLVGGLGDDVYVVNVATDVVTEAAGQGEDEVLVNFTAAGTYTMTANVEYATVVTASSAIAVNVTGNALNNDIIGHAGNNVLSGGLGDDLLEGNGGVDVLDGGAGTDLAILKGSLDDYTATRVSATQTRFVHSDGTTSVTMTNIENLEFYGADWEDESDDTHYVLQNLLSQLGSPGNDTITGTSGDDTVRGLDGLFGLNGGAGNDLINGGAGNDLLVGGAGNDTLVGGADNDTLVGGTGADTYRFGAGGGNDVIQENDATALVVDTLIIEADSGNLAGGEVRMTRSSTDATDLVLTITSGDDADVVDQLVIDGFFTAADGISVTGGIEQIRFTDGNVTLSQAQILSELLKGTGSGDWIRGYAGNDSINGLEGNDTLFGAAGNDTLVGNLGDDRVDGEAGNDLLQGNLGNDTLDGGEGNDVLDGGAGHDSLVGGNGADALLGGAGNDVLEGGAGLDTLTGGAGNDTLTGGADADRFVLNSLSGIDEITDFVAGIDKIAINKSVFTAVTGAVSATPTTLAGLGGAFAYDGGSGELTYDADGAGGADAIVVANIGTGLSLANDFLIIG